MDVINPGVLFLLGCNIRSDLQRAQENLSNKTLINYSDWEIPFTVHTDSSDKHLGYVISNKKLLNFSQ